MGMESLSPGGYREFPTLQTLRAINVDLMRRLRVRSQVKNMAYFFIDYEDLNNLLDLERSKKVDLGRCRSQESIRSPSFEGKHIRRAQFGCELIVYLWEIPVNESFTGISHK